MAERDLTFANFNLSESVYDIGDGVLREMADATGHELAPAPDVDNLGGLIGAIGPAKELQANISHVQEILGTDQTALNLARGWVTRTGLLTPVERHFPDDRFEVHTSGIKVAIITGGVRNWMARRELRLAQLSGSQRFIPTTLLVAGNRVLKSVEGPDVTDGMTEADYLESIVKPRLNNLGLASEVVRVDSEVGNDVMRAAAEAAARAYDFDNVGNGVAIVSNAGAWVQNAGQFRRALREIVPSFDETPGQLLVVSDGFKLGETGAEPTSTHQNPFTALGQIARNAQELAHHQ